MLKNLIQLILRSLARKVLNRYHPKVVGLTGSVGKTSTKEAIYCVLKKQYRCRRNKKNYNNELGVPLTILGRETGNKNPLAWLGIIWSGLRLAYGRRASYPEILILEMGADHPKDIEYLVKFTQPTVGVVTAVGPVHLEYFSRIENIVKEKSRLIAALPASGCAVLNADDDLVMPMREKTAAKVVTFGFGEKASIQAHDVHFRHEDQGETKLGLSFKVTIQGSTFPVSLPNIIGRHQIYSALAALGVGASFGMNAVTMTEGLKDYQPPPGRMNLIPGIKNTFIIDDTYNSSPAAAIAALKTLAGLPVKRAKYGVFGDMAELGGYTEQGHREVGEAAVAVLNYLVTVGERARIIGETAQQRGFPKDDIYHFDRAPEAGKFLQDRIEPGDVLLVKGSQVARLEKVVKELMAEPERARELLVRQGAEWD